MIVRGRTLVEVLVNATSEGNAQRWELKLVLSKVTVKRRRGTEIK